MNAPTTAAARIRLLRWRQTALYTLVTAVCLVALAGVAGVVDADSRASSLDSEVGRSATALSHAVYYDQGTLHLESLRDDVLAADPSPVYVMEWGANGTLVPRYGSARDTWLPTPDTLREVADETRQDQETVLVDGTANDGRPLRLAGAPVWNGGQVSATVIAAGDPADGDADHTALLRDLTLVCLTLLVLAAGAGHLLSGRGMRAALHILDQQEQFLAEAAQQLRSSQPGQSVTGLLSRARLAAGTRPVEREPLRLDLLVEQLVESLTTEAEISVMASPCVVAGDPELLSQAIHDLLDNAVRHGGGSAVEVVVGEGRITVRDHGPGVPEADRERMFERSMTGGEGAGAGLAIVRWVAELHGGSARLLGDEGDGTVAELVLPTVDE